MRLIFAIVLSALAPLAHAVTQDEVAWNEADQQYRASYFYAASLYASLNNSHAEALALLNKASEADPDSKFLKDELAEGLFYRGVARLKQQQFKGAQNDFQSLGALGQADASQLYYLGLAQLWQNKPGEAEDSFVRYLALQPRSIPGYTQLAYIYSRTSRTAKAVDLLERGIVMDPKAPELYLMLGVALMDEGGMDRAETVFLKGIKESADSSSLRFQLAVLYDKRGDFSQAESTLAALIKDEPKNGQALNYLGYSYVDRDIKLPQAEALIRRAVEAEPDNLYYQDSLGWVCYKLGHLDAAKRALVKAVEFSDPGADEAIVFEHLGRVYEKLGDKKNAGLYLDKAAKLKSESGDHAAP